MELYEFRNKILNLCNVKSVGEIGNILYEKVLSNDKNFFSEYEKISDNKKDYIQSLWQYYQADRDEKKQDFTPKSLSKLLARLAGNAESFYDCCGGSGALTTEYFLSTNAKDILVEELDVNVIPFLLFNLCLRNVNATVICGNALTKEYFKSYILTSSEKYSKCIESFSKPKMQYYNVAISNPPFNIKWQPPTELEAAYDNIFPIIPPASNANFAFVFNCLAKANRAALILPCGIMGQENEKEIRQYIVEKDLLEAVVLLPNRMFESTDISTCILLLDKTKKNKGKICFVDLRNKAETEIREQNGQFGGKAHTNRTYTKKFNIITDEIIEETVKAIQECENIEEFCACVNAEKLKQENYDLTPSRYIQFQEKNIEHRAYKDIINNLNVLAKQKNSCKLIINESLAKEFGLDIDLYREASENSKKVSEDIEKICGEKIITDDYITFTKNKNEICFKSNDKEILSHLFIFFLQSWKQDLHLINQLENQYFAELRDAMLPDLMSGQLKVE